MLILELTHYYNKLAYRQFSAVNTNTFLMYTLQYKTYRHTARASIFAETSASHPRITGFDSFTSGHHFGGGELR